MTFEFPLLNYLEHLDLNNSPDPARIRWVMISHIPKNWSDFSIPDLLNCYREIRKLEKVVQSDSLRTRINEISVGIRGECYKFNRYLDQPHIVPDTELIAFCLRLFPNGRFERYSEETKNQLISGLAQQLKSCRYDKYLIQRLCKASSYCPSLFYTVQYTTNQTEMVSVFELIGSLREYMLTRIGFFVLYSSFS